MTQRERAAALAVIDEYVDQFEAEYARPGHGGDNLEHYSDRLIGAREVWNAITQATAPKRKK